MVRSKKRSSRMQKPPALLSSQPASIEPCVLRPFEAARRTKVRKKTGKIINAPATTAAAGACVHIVFSQSTH